MQIRRRLVPRLRIRTAQWCCWFCRRRIIFGSAEITGQFAHHLSDADRWPQNTGRDPSNLTRAAYEEDFLAGEIARAGLVAERHFRDQGALRQDGVGKLGVRQPLRGRVPGHREPEQLSSTVADQALSIRVLPGTMGIRDRPISRRSPGTIRRDCLDHVLIFGERHLRRILTLYSLYYNETRTHLGLRKDAPLR